jgi:hypothetical protein
LAILSIKVLDAASVVTSKPIPAADLQTLSVYLAPLPDPASLAVGAKGAMVGEADPFGPAVKNVRVPVGGTLSSGAAPSGTDGEWVVSSILFENSKRSAIVNNAWVGVGDRLDGGARVTAIERKYVIVTDAKGNRQVVPIQGVRRED